MREKKHKLEILIVLDSHSRLARARIVNGTFKHPSTSGRRRPSIHKQDWVANRHSCHQRCDSLILNPGARGSEVARMVSEMLDEMTQLLVEHGVSVPEKRLFQVSKQDGSLREA